jgi:hypothetical protein
MKKNEMVGAGGWYVGYSLREDLGIDGTIMLN